MAERIITVLNELSQDLGIPIITPEYEIVLRLVDQPMLTAQTLLTHSSLSSTGFFGTLDRLKHLNVVRCTASSHDKRVRLYSLDPAMAQLIVARFAEYRQSHLSFPKLHLDEEKLRGQSRNVRRGEKIDHLTTEYQILLYLYLMTDMTNSQLVELVDASATKTNDALKRLGQSGAICCAADTIDRRRKRYCLCDATRRTIDNSHRRVFDWLDGVVGET